MEEEIEGYKEDICPICKSDKLQWHGGEIYDEMYIYNFTCKNCGANGEEEYKLVFNCITARS